MATVGRFAGSFLLLQTILGFRSASPQASCHRRASRAPCKPFSKLIRASLLIVAARQFQLVKGRQLPIPDRAAEPLNEEGVVVVVACSHLSVQCLVAQAT